MTRTRLEGRLLLPGRVALGSLTLVDGRIAEVEVGAPERAGRSGDPDAPWLVPGFIDVHVHGGGGADAMDGPDAVRAMARTHLRGGTTAMLPTTMTNPWAAVMHALRGVAEVAAEDAAAARSSATAVAFDRAAVLGAHLEGPFISPDRLGAQPPFALRPTEALLDEVLALDVVRLVTIAPEEDQGAVAARRFAEAGVRVSAGHTMASAETVEAWSAAVKAAGGVWSGTHLFNAMTGLSGRAPGAIGALLGDEQAYAELIVDGHHVAPASVRTAFAAKGARLLLITDAIRAVGLGEGSTSLGGQEVMVQGGKATLADGTLAGSVLTMDRAVRTAVTMGVAPERALRAATEAPADYLGLRDRGRLVEGAIADVLMLDPGLELVGVWRAGLRVLP